MSDRAIEEKRAPLTADLAVRQESARFAARVRNMAGTIAGVDAATEYKYRMPRLGKIRTGIKGEDGYPKPVDYFVLPDTLLHDEAFMGKLAEIGNADPKRPRCLPIWVVSRELTDNLRSSLEFWGSGGGLKCRSYDGLEAQTVDPKTGEMVPKPCLNLACPNYGPKGCKVVSRLRFMLPDAKGLGIYQLDTPSLNNRAALACELMGLPPGVDVFLVLEQEEKIITQHDRKGNVVMENGAAKKLKTHPWMLHVRSDVSPRDMSAAAEAAKANVTWTTSDVEDFDMDHDEVAMGQVAEEVPTVEDAEFDVGESEPIDEPQGLREELIDTCIILMAATKLPTPVMQRAFVVSILQQKVELADCTVDQLNLIKEKLEARAAEFADGAESQ